MIDHVSVAVSDLPRALRFYEAVLGTIGYAALDIRGSTVGFGKKYSEFWVNARSEMPLVPRHSGAHVCLRVRSAELVDAFHAAALANGGASDGAPGLRPHDGPNGYYAAFIRDPDGNRVEAVTFTPKYRPPLTARTGSRKEGRLGSACCFKARSMCSRSCRSPWRSTTLWRARRPRANGC